MAEHNKEILDHEYDGIQEMDNNLPRWWLYLFYFTIIWAVAYVLYFHVFSIGYLQDDEYRLEMDPSYVRITESSDRFLGMIPEYRSPWYTQIQDETPLARANASGARRFVAMTMATDTTLYEMLTEPTRISAGGETFRRVCSSCHGMEGGGGVGPNLTDNYWLHGSDIVSITKTVKYGWPSKGMQAWRGLLKDDEILEVASFVMTLKGTNVPGGIAAQGEPETEQ